MVDKILAGNVTTNIHQICDNHINDNLHVFPDICEKCKSTGVIGDFMEHPGVKLEVVRAWVQGKRNRSTLDQDTEASAGHDEADRSQTDHDIVCKDNRSIPTTCTTAMSDTPTMRSRASSSTTNESAPDLTQIKLQVAALRVRTERLLTKMLGQNPPTLG
ncbi:hypothetical protein AYO20_11286 [Fonsecaea nubica]|uniref:Uncharacterized protein n=1 Tax=Fonsecaea nubica TaxID=856822 RepID=A0A178BYD8_9EURO|nr:hypothetical protein AYO20_11286 [Fonsecaea nubica]OAL21885.1 hypothetical protein AYO20_11286 [Fonsecaea nubica]